MRTATTGARVYLAEGSQGYAINGYSADQIIGDVLDQYEHHLTYLHLRQTETATSEGE